ncbi:hypothetical protein BC834DRAFT_667709 [Gloeopeniophorella convolvens]|nr:hypothetical protein BC834DRAFT_667709 [Gloeopeniophorella convolvens]
MFSPFQAVCTPLPLLGSHGHKANPSTKQPIKMQGTRLRPLAMGTPSPTVRLPKARRGASNGRRTPDYLTARPTCSGPPTYLRAHHACAHTEPTTRPPSLYPHTPQADVGDGGREGDRRARGAEAPARGRGVERAVAGGDARAAGLAWAPAASV